MGKVQQKEKTNRAGNELFMYLSCLENGVGFQSKGEGTSQKMTNSLKLLLTKE